MTRVDYLLDMDGVLSDFTSGALTVLNKACNRTVTLDRYVEDFGEWGIQNYYNLSTEQFWDIINNEKDFWLNLKPFYWSKSLLKFLRKTGDVTVVTTPSLDPDCAKQKLQWLEKYLDIKSNDVFLGSKKYLMAGNGILIDDYPKNVQKFYENKGQAILVPSNWNTLNLTFEQVKQTILNNLK